MKIFLYNKEFIFSGESFASGTVKRPNSTTIAPNWEGRDRSIYRAKFDVENQEWVFEYKPEYLEKKARELDLELATIDQMKEKDLKSGKLPELDAKVKKVLKEENENLISKRVKKND